MSARVRFYPNLSLARRVALDLECADVLEVYRAIQRRAPALLDVENRPADLSTSLYEDLCYAVESELRVSRRTLRLVSA